MEWISVKDKLPENDIMALVCNEKGWMFQSIATYIASSKVWILYNPNIRDTLLLDVTHYIAIPASPKKV